MTARKQTAIVGLKVRLREPLRKKLEVAAKKRGVSLNAELVDRLERSFSAESAKQVIDLELERAFSLWRDKMRAVLLGWEEERLTRKSTATALAEGARQAKRDKS